MIKPKSNLSHVKPYQVIPEPRAGKIRMDLNENSWGCSPKVLEALQNISMDNITVYPEYTELIEKIARKYDVTPECIIVANGGDDAIRCVFDAFVEQGDDILLPVPTYSMFKIFGTIRGANIIEILYHADFSFPASEILLNVNDHTKLIIVVNPGNPLGTWIKESDLIEILETARNSLILLDETYFHFIGKTYVDFIKRYDNLAVVHTFSKAYGLTGLRLGVIFSCEKNISNLQKINLPFAVNSLAVLAGKIALNDDEFIVDVVNHIKIEKKFLLGEFDRLGVHAHPAAPNFIFAYFGTDCDFVFKRLKENRILVRNLSSYPMLKGYLRFSIGKRHDNLQLIQILKTIKAE